MAETREHWCVGANDTGDITDWDNFVKFKAEVDDELEETLLVSGGCYYHTNHLPPSLPPSGDS